MSLKWKAIDGVRGQRRSITIQTKEGDQIIPEAACYGQWAIHEYGIISPRLKLTHIPTGRAVLPPASPTEDQLRDLIARLLVVPEFRTIRAKKALRQVGQIVEAWAKDIKDS